MVLSKELIKLHESSPTYYIDKDIAVIVGIKPAVLLSVMQHIQKSQIPIISLNQLKIINEFQSDKRLKSYLNILEKAKLIEQHELSPQNKKAILAAKSDFGVYGLGDKQCEWCFCNTFILNEHHFPIPRKDGGQEIVNICPNCHYEYHYLKYEYKVTV